MVLDIFALIVIAMLIGFVIWLVVLLGNMPGNIAHEKNHPQAQAITALSWIGLVTGVGWFAALVWAYYKTDNNNSDIQQQLDDLKNQLKQLKEGSKT